MLVGWLVAGPVAAEPLPIVERAARYLWEGNRFNADGASWCADFAVHVLGEDLPVAPSRSAKALYNAFAKAGRLTNEPQPGDLIFFWRESPSSWKGHVGIVAAVDADTIATIEGNVTGRVTQRFYRRRAVPQLLGYGRVN